MLDGLFQWLLDELGMFLFLFLFDLFVKRPEFSYADIRLAMPTFDHPTASFSNDDCDWAGWDIDSCFFVKNAGKIEL